MNPFRLVAACWMSVSLVAPLAVAWQTIDPLPKASHYSLPHRHHKLLTPRASQLSGRLNKRQGCSALLAARPSSTDGKFPSFLHDNSTVGISSPRGVNDHHHYDQNDNNNNKILSYLPDDGAHIPPQFRSLVVRATRQHMYGRLSLPEEEADVTLDEIDAVLETEFRVRDNDGGRKYSVRLEGAAVENGRSPVDRSVQLELVYILSLGALFQLPKEITLQLLRPMQRYDRDFVSDFEKIGWEGLSFPNGLAVRPRSSRWQRRRAAIRLCHAAATTTAPPKVNRTQFLQSVQQFLPTQQQQRQTLPAALSGRRLYFPTGSLRRRTVRWWRRQTARLRRHGHAGVVSYALLNCLWYTIGMAWQWRRRPLPVADATVSVILRHYLTIFGYVYAAAQVVKIVKIGAAVALAPWMQEWVLEPLSRQWGSTATAAILVTGMVGIWATVTGWPLLLGYFVRGAAPRVGIRPTGLVWGV